MGEYRVRHGYYETTLDRAGLALAAGGAIGGVLAAALSAMGGSTGPLALLSAFIGGGVLSALGMTAVTIPLWIVLHALGRRGMGNAALTGAAASFAVFLFAQTYGFGLYDAPPSDAQTWLFRWASAAATSTLLGLIGAATAAIMWRIAYREG